MDTIIVILMCIMPIKADTTTHNAQSIDKGYKIDYKALRQASKEAAISAARKTKGYIIKTK